MLELNLIQKITVWAIPVLLAITLHEAAHAYIANLLGDSTAKMLGRLTLNPFKHIDLFGTVILPVIIGFLSNFTFILGYAKPVPIHWNNLRNPRRDSALVAAAGPGSNFIMAILWAICLKFAFILNPETSKIAIFLLLTSYAGILINLVLAFLNLIPLPPLDGSRIVGSLLPPKYAGYYMQLEPYGIFILILLLFTGLLQTFLLPAQYLTIAMINFVH